MNSGAGGFDSHALPPFRSAVTSRAITIRSYQPGDEAQILAAFDEVFSAVDPSFEARPPELWRWRFARNPAGQRISLALDDEGRVLAQYAGAPQLARLAGERSTFTQGIDSFARSEVRSLGRRGLFVRTGEHFATNFGGRLGEGDPWMWGFPVRSARRIGERYLGYEPLREQLALVLDGAPMDAEESPGEVREIDDPGPEFDAFFETQASRFGALAERDARALRWRYIDHPVHAYRLAQYRDAGGTLRGFAVFAIRDFDGCRVGLLCDWLVEPEACAPLVNWAASLADRAGGLALVAILPPWCEEFDQLQDLGFRARRSPLFLVGRSYDRRFRPDFWAREWYYTIGDSDLC